MPTEREFDLEGVLHRVLSDLVILEHTPERSILDPRSSFMRKEALQRLHHVLVSFINDRNMYQRHPKWAEMNQQILDNFHEEMDKVK